MSKNLNKEDSRLWSLVTRTVRPFGSKAPMPFAAMLSAASLLPKRDEWKPTLDLHGFTLYDAHRATLEHIKQAKARKHKNITIITGLSGEMVREFPLWMEMIEIESMTTKSGGGAFVINLKM